MASGIHRSAQREVSSLVELLRRRAALAPEVPGYIFLLNGEEEESRHTYAELDRSVRRLAARLQAAGAEGERVLLLFPPGIDFVTAFFACLYAGAVAVPSYPPRPRQDQPRLQAIAADARPKVVLTTEVLFARTGKWLDGVPDLAGVTWMTIDGEEAAGASEEDWRPVTVGRDSLAFLQYTSGSTSTPKGVMVSHGNLLHNEELITQGFGHQGDELIVGWLPLYHDMGLIGNVLQPLYLGVPCVLMSPMAFLQRPLRWLKAIEAYGASTSGGPNFAYELCVAKTSEEQRAELDLSRWQVAFNGSEPIRADTLDSFARAFEVSGFSRDAFFPCYGLAEATLYVTGSRPRRGFVEKDFDPEALERNRVASASVESASRRLVSSGVRAVETDLRIVDPETLEECPGDRVGEIWVANASVAGGYWRREEQSEETFAARIAGDPDAGPFLRTGDLGFLDEGELYVTGRIKDLLILRGRNYYPQDIELASELSHELLRRDSSAAFAVEEGGEERLVVVAEIDRRNEDKAPEALAAIRRAVSEQLELRAEEVVIVRAGTIPKTTSGKIQRHACRRGFLDGSLFVVDRSALATEVPDEPSEPQEDTEAPAPERALDWDALEALPESERAAALTADLRRRAARLLRLPAAEVPTDAPVTGLGLDSLAAVELSHELETAYGEAPSLVELLEGPTLEELAQQLLQLAGEKRPAAAVPVLEAGLAEEPRDDDGAGDLLSAELLSAGQRALWFLDRLAPDAGAYNIVAPALVREKLDPAALEAAMRDLVVRHRALRSTFEDHDGEPRRRIRDLDADAAAAVDFAVEDAAGWDRQRLQHALGSAAFRPFDLKAGPLVRLRLWTRGEEPSLLLVAVHHLVADFWSMAVLLEELGGLYGHHAHGASSDGEELSLVELPLTYDDFAAWQRAMLASPRGEELWEFWSQRLGGDLPVLDLPTDRPRPRLQTYDGAAVHELLDPQLAERLESLGKERGATLFVTLLAAFQMLLARYSGQREVVVGSPTAGRTDPRLRQLVGYFVNPVALRQEVEGDASFFDLLGSLRRGVLEAFDHQDYPFPLLAERLQPDRDPSRSPIFQALFVFQRTLRQGLDHLGAFSLGVPGSRLALGELRLESTELDERRAQFDLSLGVAAVAGGLALVLEHNRNLFDRTTAARMLGHYRNLLRAAADAPDIAVGDLPLLAPEERQQLLVTWNATEAEVPVLSEMAGAEGMTEESSLHLLSLFEAQARRTPDAPAVVRRGETWTYAQLDARAEALAAALRACGLPPRGRVGVCLDRELPLVAALLASWKAGGAYVPLDPAYPRERLDFMLEDSGAAVVLTQERHRSLFPQDSEQAGYRVLEVDGQLPTVAEGSAARPRHSEHLAYVIYTSGSTGRPKGVAIEHRNAAQMAHWARRLFEPEELTAVLAATSVCFDLSIFELFVPLTGGGRVVLVANALELAELGAEEAAALDVTLINTVPSAMTELVRLEAVPESVLTVNLAGEPLKQSLVEAIYAGSSARRVYNLYGPSEDTTYSTWALQSRGNQRGPAIGRPISNTRAYLLDRRGHPAPVGVPGELYLGGAGVARGYLGRPGLTAERFLPDPFSPVAGSKGVGGRMYRTGDLVRWRADGEMDFLGRIDHQVKVRGFRIELGEIEAALLGHDEIGEAVVMTRDLGAAEVALVAFAGVAGDEIPAGLEEELRRHLRQRLPEFMVPSALVLMAELPLLPNGKVDRKALAARPVELAGEAGSAERTAPRTPLEERLAEHWSDLLGLEAVGVHDDFFRHGGHSLLATRLVARVRAVEGVDLPLSSIFEAPTVASLAQRVEEALSPEAGPSSEGEPLTVTTGDVGSEDPPPLSEAQQRLWFLDRMAPGNPAYNLPAAVHLEGPLQPEALAAAVSEIVARHRALRSTFGERSEGEHRGEAAQFVQPAAPVPLPVVDLRSLRENAGEAAPQLARELAQREAARPFDLTRGPLLRTVLLRRGSDSHSLLVNLHHIAADGWSVDVFQRELSELYAAFRNGEGSPLPPLPVQYGDYAAWQRRRLDGGELDAQIDFWRRRLAGAPAALELPTDRPRSASKTYAGGSWWFRLPAGLDRRAEELGRDRRATSFMVLLAGYAALLARESGQRDLVLGTPIANRGRVELERLIGFFVSTLALRLDLAGDPSFEELLGRVRERTLEAFAHPSVPFERLVEELQPERDAGRDPLVQAVFVVQEPAGRTLSLPGLESSVEELVNGTAKFDLTLFLEHRRDGLAGRIEYNRDLFDGTRMGRLAKHLEVLLTAAVEEPRAPLSQLPWLSAAERHQLLVEWRRPSAELVEERPVSALFTAVAQASPEAPALAWDAQISGNGQQKLPEKPPEKLEALSYRRLAARVYRLARYLRRQGVQRGDRVGVALERSPELITALLAVLEAGAAYVPLNPRDPAPRLALIAEDTGLGLMLTEAGAVDALAAALPQELAGGARTVLLDDGSEPWQRLPAEPLISAQGETTEEGHGVPGPADLAYIAYTSGSTGRPKGVAVPHGAVVRLVRGASFADLGPEETFLQLAPVSFDASTLEIWAPLLNGGRLALMPPGAPSLEELGAALGRFEVSTLWLTAGLFHLMVDERVEDLRGLRQLLAGGDALSAPRIRRVLHRLPGLKVINGYGPTENTTFTTCHPMTSDADLLPESAPVGRPIHRTEVLVLDGDGEPMPAAVPGELLTGGEGLAWGYWNRPALTAASFVPHPRPRTPGERVYRTGDLARWLADGRIDFLGRRDHQVKIRGFRIEPGEIEACLAEHPAVARAVVVVDGGSGVGPGAGAGASDEPGEKKRLVAFAILADEPSEQAVEPEISELRAHLERRLPAYMVPAALAVVPAIPLTANGKVDRKALLAQLPEMAPEAGGRAPRTPVEELLAEIWADVLSVPRVSIDDDFFELGGHSLMATRVVSRVREAFSVELPLAELFERSTVAQLAELLAESMDGGGGAVVPPPLVPGLAVSGPAEGGEASSGPLSFAQNRLWLLDRLEAGNPSYNLPAAVHFRGTLDRRAFALALGDLVARQESLRTTFSEEGGEPLQVVHPPAPADRPQPVPLPAIDLSGLASVGGAVAAQREARRLAQREARRLFDLEAGPLFRAALLILGGEHHVALVTLHHIIADGWSVGVLQRELASFYGSRTGPLVGEASAAPPAELAVTYRDYAVWQRRWLEDGALEGQLEYWRSALGSAKTGSRPPVLDLPTDYPRPAVQSYRGRTLPFVLDGELTLAVEELSRRAGATPFMTLLAVFATLLSRYSGQDDFTVGTPIANRDQRAVEDLIGFFVNTLVLRLDLSRQPTFLDLLGRVRSVSLGAYAHQHLPFERLVEELSPQRDRSHSPLFQVMFVLQNAGGEAAPLPGLEASLEPVDTRTSKFDLTLFLERTGSGGDGRLEGRLEYSQELFDDARMERLTGHFEQLLRSAVADPDAEIRRLPLLTAAEGEQILHQWNDTAHHAPGQDSLAGRHLWGLVEAQARRTPDAEALAWRDGVYSYGELSARARTLGRRLQALGIGPEVRAGVCLERGPDLVVAILGVLAAGGAYVPLDPAYPKPRLAFMLEDSAAAVLLTEESCRGLFTDLLAADGKSGAKSGSKGRALEVVLLDRLGSSEEEPDGASAGPPDGPVSLCSGPGNLAYLIYTSGSTGRPKGVAIEHRSAAALAHWGRRRFSDGELAGVLAATSVCFDLSIYELFVTLAWGGRVILAQDALELAQHPRRKDVTLVNTVPSAMTELLRLEGLPESVRTVNLAGEPLSRSLTDALFAAGVKRVLDLYGPSEDTTYSTIGEQSPEETTAPSIGRPVDNTRAYLLDRGGEAVPVGVPGELYLGGEGLARGYLGRPALTAQGFVPDPFSRAGGARLYRTGDLARWRPDGQLDFLGRLDHQVKVRGFRIELGEIEAALEQHAGVKDVAVVTRSGAGGAELVAFLVPKEGVETSAEALRKHLKSRLPSHMVPHHLVPLAELPMLPNGKVDRKGLAARPLDGADETAREPVAPRTPVEEILVDLWSELLGGRTVGVHDDFFDLGGHSLLAARMVARVRDALEVELELPVVFEATTVAELAQRLDKSTARASAAGPPLVPVPRQAAMPVSPAQRRMWLLESLDPGGASYHLPASVSLRGSLDLESFTAALATIAGRHEALRTVFREEKGLPVQVVRSHDPEKAQRRVPLVDLSRLQEAAAASLAGRLELQSARRPFDLRRGPLLRTVLLRLPATEGAEDHHRALVNLHHIVSDGWSVGILNRELAALYAAFQAGEPSPLAPLPVQYADYAVWHQELVESAAMDAPMAYWRRQLAGLEALDLPADRPRPAGGVQRGAYLPVSLPGDLVERLEELGRKSGVTLFMTLLTAFQVLLARYSGQRDFAVGTPVAGRGRTEVEGLIGLFVNTLVLRAELEAEDAAPSFEELLRRVRRVCVDAFAHQELPFERLVDELQPDRDLSHSPLFQVMFMLQPAAAGELQLPGLEVSVQEPDTGTSKFDLSLALHRGAEGLEGRIEYSRELFDRDRMARMAGHLEALLTAAVAEPQRRWDELPLLTAAESEQLLEEWAGTEAVAAGPRRLDELVFARAAERPEGIALMAGDEELSYRQLTRYADTLARRLRALGVGPEVRVGVCLERTAALVASILGVLRAGGAYVPLDPAYPEQRLSFMLEDSRSAVLITRESLRHLFPELPASCRLLSLDESVAEEAEDAVTRPAAGPGEEPDERHLAYLIYTSGSTGRPKGVAIEHRQAAAMVAWARGLFGADELRSSLAATSVCFDLSVFELFVPLAAGGTVVLVPDALAFASSPHRDRVTLINTVPSAITELLRLGAVPPSVRTVNLAGEPLQRSLVQRLYDAGVQRVYNLYGPSEDTTYSTWALQRAGEAVPPIGRPVAGSRAYVLDARHRPVPAGVPGELFLGGAGVARGYLGRPELTAERFIPDSFRAGSSYTGGGRLYRTGDLVRWRADGELEFLGRIDHQVKVRGFRIELGEIEAALLACPGVGEAVVMTHGQPAVDQRLVAYVGLEEGTQEVTGAALRERLAHALPDYMVPAAIVLLESLPQLPNGKIDRKTLATMEPGAAVAESEFVAPRTPVEETLAELWSRLLSVPRVGVHDNFFSLGGHSLLAAQVVAAVRGLLEVNLPLRTLFEHPTVAQLAAAVTEAGTEANAEASGAAAAPPLERHRGPLPETGYPLSYAQERLWFFDQLEPDNPSYNIPAAYWLDGELDAAVLERALEEIRSRHQALGTVYGAVDGKPVQRPPELQGAGAKSGAVLEQIDLQDLEPAAAEARALELAQEEARRPFDLAQGPVLRVQLVRVAEERHLLILNLHHIAGDGWSVGVFFRELGALYRAFRAGDASPLAPLPVQYHDYALWQRGWLQGEVLEAEVDHWRHRLAGVEVLQLPTDRPRPAVQTWRGELRRKALDPASTAALDSVAQGHDATRFMVLLAVFAALLQRMSRQDDIAVGTPSANRDREQIEGLIGFFVNTLVLRTDVSGHPTLEELLERVRSVTLDAFSHQDLPFERLVDELAPDRSLSHSPLFQVMFTVLGTAAAGAGGLGDLELEGLESRALELHNDSAKFDLMLTLERRGEGWDAWLGYNSDLFDESTGLRLLGHLERLLAGALASPRRRLAEIPLLSAAEAQQLAVEWTDTSTEIRRAAGPPALVHQLFRRRAQELPEAVAVYFPRDEVAGGGWGELTFEALETWANRLAHRLLAEGVEPEAPVGLCVERGPEMLVATLAIWKAGGAFLPLDPSYPEERLAFMHQDSSPKLVLTRSALVERLPAEAETILLDGSEGESWSQQALAGQPAEPPDIAVAGDHLAYLIYTSGTTGHPKAVAVEHRNLAHTLDASHRRFAFRPGDRMLYAAAYSFDISLFESWGPLTAGGSVELVTHDQILAMEPLVEAMERVTLVHSVPALMRQLVAQTRLQEDGAGEEPERRFPGVRRIFLGGDFVPADLLRETAEVFPQARLEVLYGPTEGTIICSSYAVPRSGDGVRGLLGRPLPDVVLRVLDDARHPVPLGIPGEIHIGGPGVTRGYWNRPELTDERFITLDGERHYRTGDLGRWLPGGNLEFLGRADHQVKVRGFRIELGEIETTLREHPRVAETVVLARQEESGDRRLVAYVVPEPGDEEDLEEPTAAELRKHLETTLAEYMVPSAFVFLDQLPLSPTGKVDRKALPAPEAVRGSDEPHVAPQGVREEILARVWAEVLGLPEVGVEESFFELGGDSILSIQVVARAQQAGLRISAKQIFEHQTIQRLAEVAESAPHLESDQGPVEGPAPLVPIQRRFFQRVTLDRHHFTMPLLLEPVEALRPRALERSLELLAEHHDALRLRFPQLVETDSGEGVIDQQEHAPASSAAESFPLSVVDLSRLPSAARRPALEAAAAGLQTTLDLAGGPVARAVSFRLEAGGEERLLLVLHHLVVDGVSWRILLEDLQTAYRAVQADRSPLLPPKTSSLRRWAEALEEHAASGALDQELEHWRSMHGAGSGSVVADGSPPALVGSAEAVEVELEEETTRALLQEIHEAYGTRVQEVLLTALALAFGSHIGASKTGASKTGASALPVALEGHGREELFDGVDVSRTVGWL
ncbi:MAG: non-ribosomal peptide synthase/polyketide synthase, partial [Acidobacteriota bacterium]|nr:non-ribosomal peptide synthase/polyketide synthase [Acidobacteriota bacterium]